MLVLEAMAKDLDKDINILKCAVPYFKYADKKAGYIEHEPKLAAWFFNFSFNAILSSAISLSIYLFSFLFLVRILIIMRANGTNMLYNIWC